MTEQQQKQIKSMVAVGNAAGAQKILLGELEKQFGTELFRGGLYDGTEIESGLGFPFVPMASTVVM